MLVRNLDFLTRSDQIQKFEFYIVQHRFIESVFTFGCIVSLIIIPR
jgi:hypothetical protein